MRRSSVYASPGESNGDHATIFHRFDVTRPDQPAVELPVENCPGPDAEELSRMYTFDYGRCMSLAFHDHRAGSQTIGVFDWYAESLRYYRAVFDPSTWLATGLEFDLFLPDEETPLHFGGSSISALLGKERSPPQGWSARRSALALDFLMLDI